MKTRKDNLKLAVMSVGFLFLFSCTGDVKQGSAFINSSFYNKAVNGIDGSVKQDGIDSDANQIIRGTVIPFFFGNVEATLN